MFSASPYYAIPLISSIGADVRHLTIVHVNMIKESY